MGLDIWYKDDIRNVLMGIGVASAHVSERYTDSDIEAYRAGFQAALAAIALGLGIRPSEVVVRTVAVKKREVLPAPGRGE
jgi:hypothetical protein